LCSLIVLSGCAPQSNPPEEGQNELNPVVMQASVIDVLYRTSQTVEQLCQSNPVVFKQIIAGFDPPDVRGLVWLIGYRNGGVLREDNPCDGLF
jgi:hypothetical protein